MAIMKLIAHCNSCDLSLQRTKNKKQKWNHKFSIRILSCMIDINHLLYRLHIYIYIYQYICNLYKRWLISIMQDFIYIYIYVFYVVVLILTILYILLWNFVQIYPRKTEICICVQLWELGVSHLWNHQFLSLRLCTLCYSKLLHVTLISASHIRGNITQSLKHCVHFACHMHDIYIS